jgi:hypothetical protein
MDIPAPAQEVVTTGTLYTWVDNPMIVALIFALAGAFFVSIYFLRRRKDKK